MYGTESGLFFNWRKVTFLKSHPRPNGNRGWRAGRSYPFLASTVERSVLEMMNDVGHKKPISGSAASRTSDYRVRLQFVGKIWERVCGKVPRSIDVPLFPRGIRTSHRSRPSRPIRRASASSRSVLAAFLPSTFSRRDTWPERKKTHPVRPRVPPGYEKASDSVLKIGPSTLQTLGRVASAGLVYYHNRMQYHEADMPRKVRDWRT